MKRVRAHPMAWILIASACTTPVPKTAKIAPPVIADAGGEAAADSSASLDASPGSFVQWAANRSPGIADRPDTRDIKQFVADPIRPGRWAGFADFKITQADLETILSCYHIVSRDHWCNAYSHVALSDCTGKLVLNDGRELKWMVRPGGLATVEWPNHDVTYFANELTPWLGTPDPVLPTSPDKRR